jgi:hypothetical protein
MIRLPCLSVPRDGMRPLLMMEASPKASVSSRFYSIIQAKDTLNQITGHLFPSIDLSRRNRDIGENRIFHWIPLPKHSNQTEFDVWNECSKKFLNRSTSKFSKQDQLVIDVLVISHRLNSIETGTCIQPEPTVFVPWCVVYCLAHTLCTMVNELLIIWCNTSMGQQEMDSFRR